MNINDMNLNEACQEAKKLDRQIAALRDVVATLEGQRDEARQRHRSEVDRVLKARERRARNETPKSHKSLLDFAQDVEGVADMAERDGSIGIFSPLLTIAEEMREQYRQENGIF